MLKNNQQYLTFLLSTLIFKQYVDNIEYKLATISLLKWKYKNDKTRS